MGMIAWGNHVRASTASVTTGTASGGLPIDNVLDPALHPPARVTPNNFVVGIQFDFGQALACRALAVLGHNLGAGPTVTFKLGTTPGGAQVYSSGALDVEPPITPEMPAHTIAVLGQDYSAQYLTVVIAGAPDPTDIGHIWASRALIDDELFGGAWSMRLVDTTLVARSRSQTTHPHQRAKFRQLDIPVGNTGGGLDFAGAFGADTAPGNLSLLQMDYEVGQGQPLLVLPRIDDPFKLHRLAIYGYQEQTTPFRHSAAEYWQKSLRINEEL